MTDLTELKKKHRVTWASGNYQVVAEGIQPVADHVVRSARIRPGERVLDIACGTGNVALMARARGAAVTGLDLTPELLAMARQRAAEEQLDGITWHEGDAENLPFADGAFDVVVSACGLMFAPDQEKVAREVARVTRRGGRVAIQAWNRDGGVGRLFDLTGRHVPPTAGSRSPFEWGHPQGVLTLLGDAFRDYRFERYDCPEYASTPEALTEQWVACYGPTHRAYHALPQAQAAAFLAELTSFFRSYLTPADGKVRWGREYLVTLATRA